MEGNVRDTQQREVQNQWTEFTVSLEETLGSISANTSSLMADLFSGLLRLQSFTRDSMKFVAEELRMLEGDVKDVRGELTRVQGEIDSIATGGVSKVEELAEMSQRRLSMVLPLAVLLIEIHTALEAVYDNEIQPITEHLRRINHEMVPSQHLTYRRHRLSIVLLLSFSTSERV